jgi:hypothetical protein
MVKKFEIEILPDNGDISREPVRIGFEIDHVIIGSSRESLAIACAVPGFGIAHAPVHQLARGIIHFSDRIFKEVQQIDLPHIVITVIIGCERIGDLDLLKDQHLRFIGTRTTTVVGTYG